MAFNKNFAELSQQSRDGIATVNEEELFSMTAVPSSESVESAADAGDNAVDNKDGGEAEEGFFEDIGYNKFVADYNDASAKDFDEEFNELKAKVDTTRQLQRTANDLKADLMQTQKQNAAASRQDAAKQKESDEKMEQIRKMEEDVYRIYNNSIPMQKERIKRLEYEKGGIESRIAEGDGWTDEQNSENSSLTDTIDHSRAELAQKHTRLDGIRSRLEKTEKEVEASIKRRDESIANIDTVNVKMDDARECVLAAKQQVSEIDQLSAARLSTVFVIILWGIYY